MAHDEFERKAFDGLKLYFQDWETKQNLKGVHLFGSWTG